MTPLPQAHALEWEEYPSLRLGALDKVTARTVTFDAAIGSTLKFGEIYIKIQSCRKPPPVEKQEAAAFLQIWEVDPVQQKSRWIFSGWTFSSSPALSGMDHPVYDIWLIDCLGKDPEELPPPEAADPNTLQGEGAVPENSVPQPAQTPDSAPNTDASAQQITSPEQQRKPAPNPAPTPEPTQSPAQGKDDFNGIY
ncbi:MAG: DUF2155 domain-containing protein [Pseudobdellovibrionaceae bacterium]